MINRIYFAVNAVNKRIKLANKSSEQLLSCQKPYYFTRSKVSGLFNSSKPTASEVLTCHLNHSKFPPWTSYFVKYENIVDDQWGKSHFNWTVEKEHNYHILRTGCYPYIKYHCTKRPHENLSIEDTFFRVIKVLNLGIPCLAYGIAAIYLIKHTEKVPTSKGPVTIYFLYEEDKGSMY